MDRLQVVFKTKGGVKKGMGDVTSSLAMAEGFRARGGRTVFIINNDRSSLDLVKQKGFEFVVAETPAEITKILDSKTTDISVLNQLNTTLAEAAVLKRHSRMLVTVEDTGEAAMISDLRFNILYPIANSITDFRYIPLDTSFQEKRHLANAEKKIVNHILIMQGGSDTYGYTPKIVRSLGKINDDVKISVVLGPNFLYHAKLKRALDKTARTFNIIRGKNNLSDLMAEADLAISAGGNTLFELACLGIPTIVVCGEPFEVKTAERLQENGFGINLGFGGYLSGKNISNSVMMLVEDFNLRVEMSRRGKDLIDGCGVNRAVNMVTDLFHSKCNV